MVVLSRLVHVNELAPCQETSSHFPPSTLEANLSHAAESIVKGQVHCEGSLVKGEQRTKGSEFWRVRGGLPDALGFERTVP